MTSSIRQTMGAREWAMLIALSVLWGGSFFFVEIANDALPPLTIVTLRVGLAAPVLWALIVARGIRVPRAPEPWVAFLGMGLLNNVIPFSLIVYGQTEIASGLAAIFNATTPLFTVVVAGVLLADERMTGRKMAGVVVGLLGVAAIIGPDALRGLGAHGVAQLAVLGGALSYAFAGVYGRRFKTMGVDPVVTAAGQVTASSVVMLPVALVVERPFQLAAPELSVWAAVIALAVLSTALAYILYFRILAASGATNLLLVTFLIPVSAILLGSLVLGERLAPVHFVGMASIGAGLAAIDGRLWARVRARRAGSRVRDADRAGPRAGAARIDKGDISAGERPGGLAS